ncbi:hypothetical protein [Candidatus Stoquefichus massiliensis]|uniref:hypothetical protein n=1 Tax=Candidatus Stoquefichus massiliensis TaxID=1470350 RepID=UPI00047FE409|nr:hypothetical protein [Candidatus Stoquefichus massiliensis]
MKTEIKNLLLYFSLKYNGVFKDEYNALAEKEDFNVDEFIKLRKNIKHKYITLLDDKYPDFLKTSNCPPFVMYYQGNLELIDSDLPVKFEVLESGHRMISTVAPYEKNGKMMFDYVVGCENEKELEKLIDHIHSKGLELKDYSKHKKKDLER